MSDHMHVIHPEGWAPARGYANGMEVRSGRLLFVAGQIAWDADRNIVSDDYVEQFGQALANFVTVVTTAGGKPTDVARMTIYTTDIVSYRARHKEIGERWRALLGKHYPAMALIGIKDLVDPRAAVEIEGTAVLAGGDA